MKRVMAAFASIVALMSATGCAGDLPRAAKPEPRESNAAGIIVTALVYDERDPLNTRSDDPGAAIQALIDAVEKSDHVPAENIVKSWNADGVRLFAAPTARMRETLAAVRPCRPIQRVNFGEMLTPMPIYSGPGTDNDIRLRREDETLTLPGGQLRLLARCYAVPGEFNEQGVPRAAIRLDLALQHAEPSLVNVAPINPFEPTTTIRPEDQGGTFRTLDFSIDLDGSMTLVLMARAESRESGSMDITGPIAPLSPTAGEVLLSDFESLPRPTLRTIVVIEASCPAMF
jgi:hypothetical protein